HKSPPLRRMIGARGARLWDLPPSSPDLNPIEQAFAGIKHRMRTARKQPVRERGNTSSASSPPSNPANATTTSPMPDTLPSERETVKRALDRHPADRRRSARLPGRGALDPQSEVARTPAWRQSA
ncbi:MAG: transposase, partial [Pseudolabrys sp.]|nr:transposase [Pseudolabrys sp.]